MGDKLRMSRLRHELTWGAVCLGPFVAYLLAIPALRTLDWFEFGVPMLVQMLPGFIAFAIGFYLANRLATPPDDGSPRYTDGMSQGSIVWRWVAAGVAVVALGAAYFMVWGRYAYYEEGGYYFRVDRVSGKRQVSRADGWR